MSDGRDQLDGLRRTARRWGVAGGVLTLAAGAWAVWPPSSIPVQTVQLRAGVPAPKLAKTPGIDLAAFNAPIWNPTPPPKPPVPLPPLRLQLIAITREIAPDGAERFRAAVYDPEINELAQVIAGERVAGREVLRVTATELEVSDTAGSRKLVLDTLSTGPGGSGGGAGGVP